MPHRPLWSSARDQFRRRHPIFSGKQDYSEEALREFLRYPAELKKELLRLGTEAVTPNDFEHALAQVRELLDKLINKS